VARFGTGTEVAPIITPSLGISSLDLGPPQWVASSFLGISGNTALFASNVFTMRAEGELLCGARRGGCWGCGRDVRIGFDDDLGG
jgi:hypothetical protein